MNEQINENEYNSTEIWTVEECARFLKLKPSALYTLTRERGKQRAEIPLPHFKIHSKGLRFLRTDVERWVTQLAKQGRKQ